MIIKELDPFVGTESFEIAGRRAEEQMAFYLKREFGHYDNIFVLNSLRIEHATDACQIDHLIVHPWGFVIVESKSVTTEVRINENGEWSRLIEGVWAGMPSPINQAELQFKLLKLFLDANAPTLLGKLLIMQKRFGGLRTDVYAAISDRGIVHRPVGPVHSGILKADATCAAAITKILSYKALGGTLGFLKSVARPFGDECVINISRAETRRTAEFLLSQHRPLAKRTAASGPDSWEPSSHPLSVSPPPKSLSPELELTVTCDDCGVGLSSHVVEYCSMYARRFRGNRYCMKCQRKF